jgi:hypothetical protein
VGTVFRVSSDQEFSRKGDYRTMACACSAINSFSTSTATETETACDCVTQYDPCISTDMNIIQGEDIQFNICQIYSPTTVNCLYKSGKLSTSTDLCAVVGDKVRIACSSGCPGGTADGVYTVTAITAATSTTPAVYTLDVALPITQDICYETSSVPVAGCPTTTPVVAPQVWVQLPSAGWILEGSIYHRQVTTGSRIDYGFTTSAGSNKVYSIDQVLVPGDKLSIPGASISGAKVVRTWVGSTAEGAPLYFAELSKSATVAGCFAGHAEIGSIAQFAFDLQTDGCWLASMSGFVTDALPFYQNTNNQDPRDCNMSDVDCVVMLGWYEIFATLPVVATTLKPIRKLIRKGSVYLKSSYLSMYDV